MSEMLFRLTAGTNVGCIRTNNEDNFIVNSNLKHKDWLLPGDASDEISLDEDGAVLVVADGMGGMNAGEVASAIAVETIKEVFNRSSLEKIRTSAKKIEAFLKDAVTEADANIKAKVKEDESTSGMGTTIVIAWVLGDVVHIVWCGDSRAYRFNHKSGLTRLSKDHSYVQELVDAGKLDAELAFDHPNSNIITRSLGDSSAKARPDYTSCALSEGDYILLCSDGLCGLCRDEETAHVMAGADSIELCRTNLINAALEAGGYDNVTVALFEVVSLEGSKEEKIDITTNDIKKVKERKRRSRRSFWVFLLAALVCVCVWLYYSGNLEPLMEAVKPMIEKITNLTNR